MTKNQILFFRLSVSVLIVSALSACNIADSSSSDLATDGGDSCAANGKAAAATGNTDQWGHPKSSLPDAPPPAPMSPEEEAAYQQHRTEWEQKWKEEGGFEGHHPNWDDQNFHDNSSSSSVGLSETSSNCTPDDNSQTPPAQIATSNDTDSSGHQSYEDWKKSWDAGGSAAYHKKWYEENADVVDQWEQQHKASTSSTGASTNDQANDPDGDDVYGSDDLCPGTPQDARVWTYGEWQGCAEGQRRS